MGATSCRLLAGVTEPPEPTIATEAENGLPLKLPPGAAMTMLGVALTTSIVVVVVTT